MKTSFRILLLITIFSIAMGFMESAVVIYLRKIYYAEGFHLPLKVIEPDVALVELFREGATLIMLVAIALIAGKNGIQRFAYFLICFSVWDIFYYVFLKLFLNWPKSFLEGDVLFLIPVPWFGPVLAPCLLSLTMILAAGVLLREEATQRLRKIGWKKILLMIAGSCIVIFSFIINHEDYIQVNSSGSGLAKNSVIVYNWWLFAFGEVFILLPVILMLFKKINHQTVNNKNFIL